MEEDALAISAYEESERHVLVLSGELDMSGVAAFEAAATQLCRLGARELLVDISDVGFIDSSGLRGILTVKAICDESSCGFSMTHGSGQAERLFELTRLVELLPFRRPGRTRSRREIELDAQPAGGEDAGPSALV